MRKFTFLLVFALFGISLVGCGNNQPNYLVINRYHFGGTDSYPVNTSLSKEWLITDGATAQKVYQALLKLPAVPQGCTIQAGYYNYHLAFYENNNKAPLLEADFNYNTGCNQITISGQGTRSVGSSFYQLLSQTIGAPLDLTESS